MPCSQREDQVLSAEGKTCVVLEHLQKVMLRVTAGVDDRLLPALGQGYELSDVMAVLTVGN